MKQTQVLIIYGIFALLSGTIYFFYRIVLANISHRYRDARIPVDIAVYCHAKRLRQCLKNRYVVCTLYIFILNYYNLYRYV